jgi:hypothetical protein
MSYILFSSPSDLVKEDEMGRGCSMHWREEECTQGFVGKVGIKDTIRETMTGRRMILKWILEK